jgi:hypothetical protein
MPRQRHSLAEHHKTQTSSNSAADALLLVVVWVRVQEEVLLNVFDEALQTDIYTQEQDWIRQEQKQLEEQQAAAAAEGAAADGEQQGKPHVPQQQQQQHPSQLLQHDLSQQQQGQLQQQHFQEQQQQQQRRHQTPEVQQQQQQFFGQGMRGPSPILTPPPGVKLCLRNMCFTPTLQQQNEERAGQVAKSCRVFMTHFCVCARSCDAH